MNTESLEKLCRIVERQIEKAVDVLDREGGKLPANDAEYLDKLTHTLKSIKTTLAMEGYGSSGRRDSMGRYSREGSYEGGRSFESSMHGDNVREELRRMMNETGDERVKRALHEAMREL
ncbi:MAG: hypothetical protein J6S60_04565 [Oscillospiraceae bacterium]|nr:hypothetical protein [Oscillospiraceae bacterium]